MANNGIFYTSGNTIDFTTTGTTWARLSSGGTFSSLGLSATTYYNLPGDYKITGGTYQSNLGILSLTNLTGGTVSIDGQWQYVTGITYNTLTGIIAYRQNTGLTTTIGYLNYVTGGTYSSGTLNLKTNTGQTISIGGFLTGTANGNYIPKWTGSTSLGDSRIYDDGTFVGIDTTAPTYGETVGIITNNKGVLIDDAFVIQTAGGSLAFATRYDYSTWGGSSEIAIGTRGPLSNSTGSGNIGIGDKALLGNTSGTNNIAIGGSSTLLNNDDGGENISIGNESMNQNISGSQNVSIGNNSFFNNTTGGRNVSIGTEAGYSNNSDYNVFLGRQAGYSFLGSNSIFIGANSTFPNDSQNYVLSIGDTIYGDLSTKYIGINVTAQTNTLHVSASTDPVRFEGLQLSSNTRYLVSDGNGVVTYRNLPGSSASDCFGTFYTSAISGCSPVTILTPLNATDGLNVTGTSIIQSLSATSFSASTYQGNVVSQITAGSGISIDQSTGNVTITATGGGSSTGLTPSDYVVQGKLSANQSISANTDVIIQFVDDFDPNNWWNSSTYQLTPTIAGYYNIFVGVWLDNPGVTNNQGNVQVRKNGNSFIIIQNPLNNVTGQAFEASKIVYLNGTTDYVDFTIYQASTGSVNILQGTANGSGTWFSASLIVGGNSAFTGGTILGATNFTGGLTANTISATTYQNLPISGVTDGSGISTSITNGNLTITATGGGGGGLTFQQVQMVAFLTS